MVESIVTEALTKSFGMVTAVDKVSLSVKKGEIYGFIGLNGAGKTTTIRMMLGMITPTTGRVWVMGKAVERGGRGPWEKVGCIVEVPHAYPELTVVENLEMIRKLRRITDTGAVQRVIDALKLSSYAERKSAHLSLGNAQRLGIAKALLHQPEILILDEPVNGLDPAGIVEIRALLKDLAENRKVTVFISSHLLGEIAKIADKVGVLDRGTLVQEITAADLDKHIHQRLVVKTRSNKMAEKLLRDHGVTSCTSGENGEIFVTDAAAIRSPETIASVLVAGGTPPVKLVCEEEDLEAYFLRIIAQRGE